MLSQARLSTRREWLNYLYAGVLVVLTTLISTPIHFVIEPTNLVMLYLVMVIVAALFLGRGPAVFASLTGAIAFDFFFVKPRFSLSIDSTQYVITLFGLLLVSLVIGDLVSRLQEQAKLARLHEQRTAMLYDLSRELTHLSDIEAIAEKIIEHVTKTFQHQAVLMLPQGGRLATGATSPGLQLDMHASEALELAFREGMPAGRDTVALPQAPLLCQPLITARGVVGVLGVMLPEKGQEHFPQPQRQFLDAYASLAALAIERAILQQQTSQVQVLQAGERLQTALLNSVSHDLRTPLASITGVLESLYDAEQHSGGVNLSPADRQELIETAREEAVRLNRLVGNLLDITRLESGALRLKRGEADISDLAGAAIAQLGSRLQDRQVITAIPSDLPPAWVDFSLLVQVLVNLLENAAKYSPEGRPVYVEAAQLERMVEITVRDQGPGIPTDELEMLFDKHYSRKYTTRLKHRGQLGGLGLGLSICKGIVDAHGGRIWASNHPAGGLAVTVALPLQAEPEAQPAEQQRQIGGSLGSK